MTALAEGVVEGVAVDDDRARSSAADDSRSLATDDLPLSVVTVEQTDDDALENFLVEWRGAPRRNEWRC